MQKLDRYPLYSIVSLAALLWLAVGLLVYFTSPLTASAWVWVLMYSLLFAAFLFTIYPVQISIRERWLPKIWEAQHRLAFRQSALITVLLVGFLYLQAERLLFWWVAVSFALLILSLEVFFNL